MFFRVPDILPKSGLALLVVPGELQDALSRVRNVLAAARGDLIAQGVDSVAAEGAALLQAAGKISLDGLQALRTRVEAKRSRGRWDVRLRHQISATRAELAEWILGRLAGGTLGSFSPEKSVLPYFVDTYLGALAEAVPETVTVDIHRELLYVQDGDGRAVRLRKAIRRMRLRLRAMPTQATNLLRRAVGRPAKAPSAAQRTVNIGALTRFYVRGVLPFRLHPSGHRVYALYPSVIQSVNRLWEVAERNNQELLKALEGSESQKAPALADRLQTCEARTLEMLDRSLERLAQDQAGASRAISEATEALFDDLSRACALAGTSELPRWRFPAARVARLHRRARLRWDLIRKSWNKAFGGCLGALGLLAEIGRCQSRLVALNDNLSDHIARNIRTRLRTPVAHILKQLQSALRDSEALFLEAKSRLTDSGPESASEFLAGIRTRLEEIEAHLSDLFTIEMPETISAGRTDEQVERLNALTVDGIEKAVSGTGSRYLVWAQTPPTWQPGDPPPKNRQIEIPVRRIVRAHTEAEVLAVLSRLHGRLWSFYDRALSDLDEAWRVVRFNTESAIAELEPAPDASGPPGPNAITTAGDVACGGLRRAARLVDGLLGEIAGLEQNLISETRAALSGASEAVEESQREIRALGLWLQLWRSAIRSI